MEIYTKQYTCFEHTTIDFGRKPRMLDRSYCTYTNRFLSQTIIAATIAKSN